MSGYPTRLLRSTFGPTLEDEYPVQNPRTQIPATAFNAAFHALAGLNLSSIARAVVVASYVAPTLTTLYQAEAWNSNESQAHPVLARAGVGDYTLTFAASYLDEQGISVPTALLCAKASAHPVVAVWADVVLAVAYLDASNPLIVHVKTFTHASGAAVDCPFVLEVG